MGLKGRKMVTSCCVVNSFNGTLINQKEKREERLSSHSHVTFDE